MNRLKFLLFALIVLALWAFHLTKLSPLISGRAADTAAQTADAAAPAVSQRLNEGRAVAATLALKLQQSPALLPALTPGKGAKPPPLSAEQFGSIQKAVSEAAPESLRDAVVTVVTTEGASFAAKGSGEAVSEGVDFAAIGQAGANGATQKAFVGDYLFYSFPVHALDAKTNEAKSLGTVAVGVPQKAPDLAALAKELNLSAIALVEGGKVVSKAGADESALAAAEKLKDGESQVLTRGGLSALGPVKLPAFTNGDAMGGGAPLLVGSRKAVSGTPYELLAVASTAASLEPLAQYQQLAIPLFGVLFLLSLVWLVLISNRKKDEGKAMVLPERPEIAPTAKSATVAPVATAANGNGAEGVAGEAPAPLSMPELPPAPEASPDDFEFPRSAAAGTPLPTGNEMPFESPGAPASLPNPFEDDQGEATRAYPATGAPDPFLQAAGGEPPPMPAQDGENGEFNPEATRVAMIPSELLQQAKAQPRAETKTALNPALQKNAVTRPAPAIAAANVNPDEAHWQDIYRDFVATREKCGEPADGLTYEKFKQKLQKNREQLVAKYNCRTVRFQVYVKEGKAALKATPVKD